MGNSNLFVISQLLLIVIRCDISRASFGFFENAPDILSDNAQCEQLDAAQEQNNDYQGGETGGLVAVYDGLYQEIDGVDKAGNGTEDTANGGNAQGSGGRGGDSFDCQVQQFEETP